MTGRAHLFATPERAALAGTRQATHRHGRRRDAERTGLVHRNIIIIATTVARMESATYK